MKKIYPDLWQSESGSHFGMNLKTYFLQTEESNAVIYYTNEPSVVEEIKQLGKVDYQYISHHHEVLPALYQNLNSFDAQLCCHSNAIPYLDALAKAPIVFDSNQIHSNNIEIIDSPGHTNTNICLRYQSPYGKSYLFTGDTIYLHHGQWAYLVLPQDGGNYEDLRDTLLKLRALQVDVVLCSVGVGGNDYMEVTQGEWHSIIDRLLGKLG